MVAKGLRDRRSASSTRTVLNKNKQQRQRRSSIQHDEKKKVAKPMGICSFCLGDEEQNAQGIPEDMIHCAECGNSGHPSCLKYSAKLVRKIQTTRWQCLECKRCIICRKADDSLLFCDLCDTAIHPGCCDPPLQTIPKGEFACFQCRPTTRSRRFIEQPDKRSLSRPVAQLIDGMSKFFQPKKQTLKINSRRQQSIQKAMNILRIKEKKMTNRIVQKSKIVRTRRKLSDNVEPTTVQNKRGRKRKHSSISLDKQLNSSQTLTSNSQKRIAQLDLSKYKTPPAFLHDTLPDNVTSNDVYLFLDARENALKLISDCPDTTIDTDPSNIRWPPYIVFGDQLIQTWYSSSYPQEYARVPRLFICEHCLKYIKCEEVYKRHRKKCSTVHPPANEIYHKDDLSVFEVDGNINRIYCQNLCLLAKLFLDHKTLYYDVEPFLFYVLTRNDADGCHFLGYFSKEKHCPQKYNLSCIMVLPHCQRRGYGRFLIELSYFLAQKENQIGTPERPLSTHGAQTYEAFWKIKLVEQLLKYHQEQRSNSRLIDLMNETGIAADDILETFQNLGILTMKSNEQLVLQIDPSNFQTILDHEKLKHSHWVSIDHEFLRFTPVLKPFFLMNPNPEEQSSTRIELVFKEISSNPTLTNLNQDNSPTANRPVVRRRKTRRKRRSIQVKSRLSTKSTTASTTIPDLDGEHSQEYVARRSRIDIEESTGESSSLLSSHINSPIDVKPIENSQQESERIHLNDRVENGSTNESTKDNDDRPPTNDDSFKKQFTSPLPFKKRAWTSALIDPSVTSNV